MNRLYTVTLTDLGTYRVTVAADDTKTAESIARTVLFEEATKLPAGMTVVKREADAKAEPAMEVPLKWYHVSATYTLEFGMTVPASTADEAERYARQMYADEPQPFEYETGDERVSGFIAREVRS